MIFFLINWFYWQDSCQRPDVTSQCEWVGGTIPLPCVPKFQETRLGYVINIIVSKYARVHYANIHFLYQYQCGVTGAHGEVVTSRVMVEHDSACAFATRWLVVSANTMTRQCAINRFALQVSTLKLLFKIEIINWIFVLKSHQNHIDKMYNWD